MAIKPELLEKWSSRMDDILLATRERVVEWRAAPGGMVSALEAGALVLALSNWLETCGADIVAKKAVNDASDELIELLKAVPSENARKGALAKLEKNPEARAKAAAIAASKVLWQERESGKHKKLRTEDQFAMEVAKRWPVIASIAAIKKRSSQWRREANASGM